MTGILPVANGGTGRNDGVAVGGLLYRDFLSVSTNINDLTAAGTYQIMSGNPNLPSEVNSRSLLSTFLHFELNPGAVQIFFEDFWADGVHAIYIRKSSSRPHYEWSSWKKFSPS